MESRIINELDSFLNEPKLPSLCSWHSLEVGERSSYGLCRKLAGIEFWYPILYTSRTSSYRRCKTLLLWLDQIALLCHFATMANFVGIES